MRVIAVAAYALFLLTPFAPAFAATPGDAPFLAPDAIAENITTRRAAYEAVKTDPSPGGAVSAAVNGPARRDMSERELVALVFDGGDW